MEREKDMMCMAYDEGVQAYWEEKDVDSCPYPAGTREHHLWMQGWLDENCADEEFDDWLEED